MSNQPMETTDCTDIKALLSGLLDDRVAAEARYRAERHLAECKACRDLLSQAELNETLIAAEVHGQGPPEPQPPEGFEAAVLSRTVYAERRRAADRWTTWFGWLAAAACLGLALTIWVLDRQAALTRSNPTVAPFNSPGGGRGVVAAAYRTGPEIKSWTLQGPLPDDVLQRLREASANTSLDNDAAQWEPTGEPRFVREEAITSATAAAPTSGIGADDAVRQPADRATISRDEAETLDAASLLLAMLAQADHHSFAHIEQIRRIAEYDDLLPRLADARGNLPAQDRPVVLAAESVLYRIVRGPLDLEEVRELRETIARLNLTAQIDAISGRWPLASSL